MFAVCCGGGVGILHPGAVFRGGFASLTTRRTGREFFRSPVNGGCRERSFYVLDDSGFAIDKNQFIVPDEMRSAIGPGPIPGLSFFDREDQQDHVKVHLPYVLAHTGRCFTANDGIGQPARRDDGLVAVTGLVETDWYPGMINLVFKLPPWPKTVHVSAGEIIAQIIPITRELQEIPIQILEGHRKQARLAFENISLNSAVG